MTASYGDGRVRIDLTIPEARVLLDELEGVPYAGSIGTVELCP